MAPPAHDKGDNVEEKKRKDATAAKQQQQQQQGDGDGDERKESRTEGGGAAGGDANNDEKEVSGADDHGNGGPGALEEDDDFDEFELHNWQPERAPAEEEQADWEDDWDSIEQEGDFAAKLAAELRRNGHQVVDGYGDEGSVESAAAAR